MMTRTRTILTPPENGGKHCPSLTQKRGCQGLKCHGQRERRVLRGNFLCFFVLFLFCAFFGFGFCSVKYLQQNMKNKCVKL